MTDWSLSTNNETFHGRYETKEAAIAEGHKDQRYPFWVGCCTDLPSPETYWYAEDWLEHVSVQDDYGHEVCEDWDQSTRAQQEELEDQVRAVMAAWLDRHQLRPKCCAIDVDSVEKIEGKVTTDYADDAWIQVLRKQKASVELLVSWASLVNLSTCRDYLRAAAYEIDQELARRRSLYRGDD